MNRRNIILIIIFLFLIVIVEGSIYYLYFFDKKEAPIISIQPKNENQEGKTKLPPCLTEDERTDFKVERLGKYPSIEYDKGFVEVVVKKVDTGEEITKFRIDDIVSPSHYHPIEIHKCGVYILRGFNFDYEKFKPLPGFRRELWKYNYGGKGGNILIMAEENKTGESVVYYNYDFRIDPRETYVVLEKNYLGHSDYAFVIKNLHTKEDVFVLPLKDIINNYPSFMGSFGMNEWTKDGKYFWGNIFDGANVLAFFRIEAGAWKWEIFSTPDGTMGGDALNTELGYITYDDGAPWTGDADFDQINREKWQKEGRKVHFYLYNLFTKKQILLETFDDPTYFTQPKWLSDTELEYELPTGEKKIYKINEN